MSGEYGELWNGVELEARIMDEFEMSFNSLCNDIRSGLYPQTKNIETLKQKLLDIAIRLNKRSNNRENLYTESDLHDLVDRLWQRYEQTLHNVYGRRDAKIEQRINEIVENKDQRFTKRNKLTLLQFFKALFPLPTIKKEDLERDADKLYTGSQSIRQWYNIYLERLRPKAPTPEATTERSLRPEGADGAELIFRPKPVRRIPKPKPKKFKVDPETKENIREEQRKFLRQNRIDVDADDIIPYPFKSKIKEYKQRFPHTPYQEIPVDPKVKSKTRKLEKPYFSPEPYSWEIDLVFNLLEQDDIYLFCININTKYLVIYKVKSKSANDVLPALEDLRNNFQVNSIKGDSERSFAAEETRRFWQHYHIKTYFSKTKFTNHNRIVDSVIRTIRNAIGYRNINDEQLSQIVNYYNNTKHSGTGFTPIEMMEDIDKEFYFIRRCNEKLLDVKKRLSETLQEAGGGTELKQGNVVLVHLELGKVAGKFEKKRKTYDRIGIFQEYINGNVRVIVSPPVQISSGSWRTDLLVPEYAVRYIAESVDTLPEMYKRTYYSDVFTMDDKDE